MKRLTHILVGLVAVATVLLVPVKAQAYVPGDPWLPPSEYTHTGVADVSGVLQGGGHPSWTVAATAVVDILYPPAGSGVNCYRTLTSPTLTREGTGPINPSDLGYRIDHDWGRNCPEGGYPDLLIMCAAPPEGFTSPSGTFNSAPWWSYSYGHANKSNNVGENGLFHDWYTNVGCNNGLQFVSAEITVNSSVFAHEGLRAYTPLLRAMPGTLSATCSDGSVVTSTGATVVDLTVACPGGVRSVDVMAGNLNVGHGGLSPTFDAWPCLAAVNACHLVATRNGVEYPNTATAWWDGTDAADACRWQLNSDSAQMWTLDNTDCEAARHDGVLDPGGQGPLDPPPATDPITGVINDIRTKVSGILSAIANGLGAAHQDAVDLGTKVEDTATKIGQDITRAVVPDPATIGDLVGRARGAMGAPLSGWTGAMGGLGSAWAVSGTGTCSGPSMTLPVFAGNYTFHPLDACSDWGQRIAPMVRLGALVMLLWEGAWACSRNLAEALGYGA
jgi:hypothetical protein